MGRFIPGTTNVAMPMSLVPQQFRWLAVLAWMGLIFWLSSVEKLPDPTPGDTDLVNIAGHLGAYGVLAMLNWWALLPHQIAFRQRLAIVFVIVLLYGISDEFHQSFVPGRRPDVKDIVTDLIGAAIALSAVHHLSGQRSWLRRHPHDRNGQPERRHTGP